MTLGDRVAVMNAGRIMQVGIPLELYNNPANRFVAGFIGSPRMNLIELAADAAGRLVPERIGKAAGEGCVLGVRPERVKVDSLPQDGKGLALRGLLLHMEALGHETLLQIAVRITRRRGSLRAARATRRCLSPRATRSLFTSSPGTCSSSIEGAGSGLSESNPFRLGFHFAPAGHRCARAGIQESIQRSHVTFKRGAFALPDQFGPLTPDSRRPSKD